MNTHDKCRLPINSAVTGGKKYVDDKGCLTGVAAVAVETIVVVALDAMATIVAGAPAGCQLGGGSSGGCVGRSSRSGSHRNHQQD